MDALMNQIHIVHNLEGNNPNYDLSGWYKHVLSRFGNNFLYFGNKQINKDRNALYCYWDAKNNRWSFRWSDQESKADLNTMRRTPATACDDINYALRSWWMPRRTQVLVRMLDAVKIINFIRAVVILI